ncbi:DUF58 domain-containing protein [Brachybacterium sp. MASK1Z-5]|uniref:DUF58 domain-containing protein n=1 Tax=Brachybacterium halotolerans TaxID=2795215 RepID=A0ABS1BBR7_9MICO|nr:DUF58 domain-containing protein [Brachybacterium halotolerans]MBK0332094.1 DUF58 domain-containing protein [Brachybacterium halotolerans]
MSIPPRISSTPPSAPSPVAAPGEPSVQSPAPGPSSAPGPTSTAAEVTDTDAPAPGPLERGRRTAQRAWKRASPALAVVSPVGWTLLAAVLGSGFLGLWLHITELNVLALALLVPLVIAAVFVLGRTSYAITLDLQSHRVVVGTRAVGRVEVRNPTEKTILPSRIELSVGSASAQFLVPRLGASAAHEELFAVPTRRRAVLVVGPVRSVRDDPLSLMRRQVTWAKAQELFVHPRTVRLDEAASGFLRDLEGTPSSDLSSSDIAFHALRDYTPGDDRRHVHWRTTARTGRLMVRQFEETRRSHVVVALADRAADFEDEDEFELAVSAAASVSVQTMREEKELTALTTAGRQRTTTLRRLLDDYTVLEAQRGRRPLRDLGQACADKAPNASAVVLVVGSQATPTELNQAATRFPPGVLPIAVRCARGAEVRRSRLGGLELVTLGRIEDLPMAMRTVGR